MKTGLHDQYHLALYEAPSIIKIEDIEALRTDHAQSFLQELILDENKIGDAGATALAESLKGNWMLKKLSIKNNRISHAGGIMLGEGLEENEVLEELYLNVNVLGDDGIVQICRGDLFQSQHVLLRLLLCGCTPFLIRLIACVWKFVSLIIV